MKLLNKFLKKKIIVKGTVEYHATSALTVGHRHILPGDKIVYAEVTKTFTINRFQRGPIEVEIVMVMTSRTPLDQAPSRDAYSCSLVRRWTKLSFCIPLTKNTSMHNFNDTSEDLHPFQCKGYGQCIHCDRTKTDDHDPLLCNLCHLSDDLRPPLPISKSVIVLPEDGNIVVNEDGIIEGAAVLRQCSGIVHVFEEIPGQCQCGDHYWGELDGRT